MGSAPLLVRPGLTQERWFQYYLDDLDAPKIVKVAHSHVVQKYRCDPLAIEALRDMEAGLGHPYDYCISDVRHAGVRVICVGLFDGLGGTPLCFRPA